MGGQGTKGEKRMYDYLEDKEFQQKIRSFSGELMQQLCHYLKEDYDIGANFYLVGSGAKNLILQNENEPVDLDYNLEIVRCENFKDCRYLKEYVRKTFNKCLRERNLCDCEDSTSSLSSKLIGFKHGNPTRFSIDICITLRNTEDIYYRLIHEKTGFTLLDRYFWNEAPRSKQLKKKVDDIKKDGQWEMVRKQYREIKNMYLQKNELEHHPSFVCYIEAVNNVYNSKRHQ